VTGGRTAAQIRPLTDADRPWVHRTVIEYFGSTVSVSRGRKLDTTLLPGFVAFSGEEPAGLLLHQPDGPEWEIVILIATEPRRGVGKALLEEVGKAAAPSGCRRLWLVTTNDNVDAQAFYEALGWTKAAVHKGAMAAARAIKPEIPRIGHGGVPIDDEIEYELLLEA